MRVVDTDNFGGDWPNEAFVGPRLNEDDAKFLADWLNKVAGPHASRFYKVVPDNYKLQPGFEP